MAKLTPRKTYRSDGSSNTNGYGITLSKSGIDMFLSSKVSTIKFENDIIDLLLLSIKREEKIFKEVENHAFNNDEH